MMDKLHQQEQSQEIKQLRALIQALPVQTKAEHEWQVLENTIIADLDRVKNNAVPAPDTNPGIWGRSFSRFALATGIAASILFAIGTTTLYIANQSSNQPLALSHILNTSGEVSYKLHSSETAPQGQLALFKNQQFETGENATCIVRIDEGSSFILSEHSKLRVVAATTRNIAFFLEQGNILASVSKRAHNQSFTVSTPDATCRIIGTIFSVATSSDTHNEQSTNLTVLEGAVEIAEQDNPQHHALVHAGHMAMVENQALQQPVVTNEEKATRQSVELLRLAEESDIASSVPRGLLDISSTPDGAAIYINDTLIGQTPLTLRYRTGTHTVKLVRPGKRPWMKHFALHNLEVVNVIATLSNTSRKTSEQQIQQAMVTGNAGVSPYDQSPSDTSYQLLSKDFGFILNPAFVEALVQMTIGEYQKALIILDSLKELPEISITDKIRIMSKIAECYKGLGNFDKKLTILTTNYDKATTPQEKSNLLWEIITVKANCLLDYEGAENDILTYIKTYPQGSWIESAYAKLGELQYITGKYAKAVGTLQYHITLFASSPMVEKSLYTIANILRMDIKDYGQAITWYTRFLKEFSSSSYYGNALFERAQCYEKIDKPAKAHNDYKKYLTKFPDGHLKALCLAHLSQDKQPPAEKD